MAEPVRLLNRNFSLLWMGQTVSRLGLQGFDIALLFWIKHATGSAALMGVILMVSSLPGVLLGPVGGTFADRYSRRKVIIASDLIRGLLVLTLAGLMFFRGGRIELILTWLFIVSMLVNLLASFFSPAFTAAIPDLVPRKKVAAANSLGQVSCQLSAFLGQGLGGVLFRLLGAPLLFLINGLTYLLAALTDSFVAIPQRVAPAGPSWREELRRFTQDTREGLRHIWRQTGLRDLVLTSAVLNFFTVPIILLLPFYIEDVLKVSVDWYGFLAAGFGVGSLLGFLLAGVSRLSPRATGSVMMGGIVLQSLGYGLLGLATRPGTALALASAGGVLNGFITVVLTTLLQLRTPEAIRGRVFGLLATIAGAIAPIAMGLSGVVADLAGHNISLIYIACGGMMTLLSVLILLDRGYRRFLTSEPGAEGGVEDLDGSRAGA